MIRVMMHQPIGDFNDSPIANVVMEAGELNKMRETIIQNYAKRTGKPLWVVSRDLDRDEFLSPEKAQDHGIIDAIITATK